MTPSTGLANRLFVAIKEGTLLGASPVDFKFERAAHHIKNWVLLDSVIASLNFSVLHSLEISPLFTIFVAFEIV